jgi:hypothetical protein
MSPPKEDDPNINFAIYLCAFVAVHACTCSALTSAVLWRHVNAMGEASLVEWRKKFRNRFLLVLPFAKFAIG